MGDELDRTFERIEGVEREIIHTEGTGGWCANVYEIGNPMPIAVGQGETREAAREDAGLPPMDLDTAEGQGRR